MKWIVYILIVAAIVIVEQSIFSALNLGLYTPDLLLLIMLGTVWATNNFDFVLFALLGGFWMEVTLGLPIGTMILSLLIAGSSAYLVINRWLFTEKTWQHFFGAVAVGTILIHFWYWIYTSILFIFGWSSTIISGQMFLKSLLPSLLVNLILTYPIFFGVELLTGYIQKITRPSVMKI